MQIRMLLQAHRTGRIISERETLIPVSDEMDILMLQEAIVVMVKLR